MKRESKAKFCELLASNSQLQELLIKEVANFKGKKLSEKDKLISVVKVIAPFIWNNEPIPAGEDGLLLASVAIRWTRAHCWLFPSFSS